MQTIVVTANNDMLSKLAHTIHYGLVPPTPGELVHWVHVSYRTIHRLLKVRQ